MLGDDLWILSVGPLGPGRKTMSRQGISNYV